MMFTMIVCNDVLDIFIHFIDNNPRAELDNDPRADLDVPFIGRLM